MGSLSCYEFGRQLIESKDLDPVYVLLQGAELDPAVLHRWLLAYWNFYHVGTASWIAEQPVGYWHRMAQAAASKEYPRCHERRHYRGENARKSVAYLRARGLTDLFALLLDGPYTLAQVMESVKEWVGFGPWIAFKVADMLERLDLCQIEFNAGAMFLFESPREGAERLVQIEQPDLGGEYVGTWAVNRILKELGDLSAPPRYERTINCQEAETVLCKWKSYLNGRYRIGEDIHSCRQGLERFPKSKIGQRLLKAGKGAGLWS